MSCVWINGLKPQVESGQVKCDTSLLMARSVALVANRYVSLAFTYALPTSLCDACPTGYSNFLRSKIIFNLFFYVVTSNPTIQV